MTFVSSRKFMCSFFFSISNLSVSSCDVCFCSVGLSNILALLKSEDLDVQLHAVKVLANHAAQGDFITYSTLRLAFGVHHKNCNLVFTNVLAINLQLPLSKPFTEINQ